MKIRMLHERTGGRYDGQAWPPPGGEFDVPDEEGAALTSQGVAEVVAPPPPDEAEKHSVTAAAARPIINAPKTDWVEYAVTLGADRDGAEASTKSDLIDWVRNAEPD